MRYFVLFAAFLVCVATAPIGAAQDKEVAKIHEEASKASETLGEIMRIPEKAIPQNILDDAECVAVFPSTIRGGLIVGARKGEGVVSCRTATGWSAPVFLDMEGGSIGAQIGVQSTDYVLLFMNEKGADQLLRNEFTIGADASVAAGPVGRSAAASTDWKMKAEILSYSRSKGLFAGATIDGVKISVDDSDMKNVYGAEVNPRGVLREGKVAGRVAGSQPTPTFQETLGRFSPRRKTK